MLRSRVVQFVSISVVVAGLQAASTTMPAAAVGPGRHGQLGVKNVPTTAGHALPQRRHAPAVSDRSGPLAVPRGLAKKSVRAIAASSAWTPVAGEPVSVRIPPGVQNALPSAPVPSAGPSPTASTSPSASPSASTPSNTAPSSPDVVVGVTGADDRSVSRSRVMTVAVTGADATKRAVAGNDPTVLADSAASSVVGADVRIDYSSFPELFGAGWRERLQVVAYPSCVLSTPDAPGCSTSTPVKASNDEANDFIEFTTLDPSDVAGANSAGDTGTGSSSSGSVVVYALVSAPGGYGAVPISPTGEWQVGVGSGEFSYGYPFSLPPALAGSAPDLGLDYSSSSVDGMTSPTNGQAGEAGVGWDLTPGAITRSFSTCSTDGTAEADLCWRTRNGTVVNELTLSMGGRSSRLLPVPGQANQYRLRDDPGWKVTHFQSAAPTSAQPSNSDNNNEGFEVQAPDGTQYWLGWGRSPSAVATNSVSTVPVYGNNAGEDCYDSTKAAVNRWCAQGWQFLLDRVVDATGNVTTYRYAQETNVYDRWAGGTGGGNTSYNSAAHLTRIEYGVNRATNQAQQVVTFSTVRRCTDLIPTASGTGDCTGADSPYIASNGSLWPDTPIDLACSMGRSDCSAAPSFFSITAYSQITSQVMVNGTLTPVDQWSLNYSFPNPDAGQGITATDTKDLWLKSISRTGQDDLGGANGTLDAPNVLFSGTALQNRVNPGATNPYFKLRVSSVRNETGGRIDVTYGHQAGDACTGTYINTGGPGGAALDKWASTKDCWEAQWYNDTTKTQKWLWFHKYLVTQLVLNDDALGISTTTPNAASEGKEQVYTYDYQGQPAWRYEESANVPDDSQTWGDWRGYATTVVKQLDGTSVVAQQKVTRFRGMANTLSDGSGDRHTAASDPEAFISTDEPMTSTAREDDPWKNGLTAETIGQDPANGGAMISATDTTYDSVVTADPPATQINAHLAFPTSVTTRTALSNPDGTANGVQTRTVTYHYNTTADPDSVAAGELLWTQDDAGTPSTAGDDTCTMTGWQTNTSSFLNAQDSASTYAADCPATDSDPAPPDTALLSRTHTWYDGMESGSGSLTKELPTAVDTSTGQSGADATVRTTTSYDAYGRVTGSTAPAYLGESSGGVGPLTTVTYNPGGDAGLATRTVKSTEQDVNTAGLDLSTTTSLDPGRGLPVSVSDPNGAATVATYNPLGQITGVWEPGEAASAPANFVYTYTTTPTAPSVVKTQVLRSVSGGTGMYDSAWDYYDGWGRQIETQTPQPADTSQRDVAVTGYDARGQVALTAPAVPNSAAPGSGLLNPDPGQIAQYSTTAYDAAGRPTTVTDKSLGNTVASTSTTYLGDGTLAQPATGGVTRTNLDARGDTIAVQLHSTHDPAAVGGSSDSVLDAATYGYDGLGQLTSMSKTEGGQAYTWRWGFDQAGRRIWSYDPDTGPTTTTYDAAGSAATVTTGHTGAQASVIDTTAPYAPAITGTPTSIITTHYDALERPTSRIDATDPNNPVTLASWGYDDATVANGLGRQTSETVPITGVKQWLNAGQSLGSDVTAVKAYDARGNAVDTTETVPAWLGSLVATNPGDTTTYEWTNVFNQAGNTIETDYPAVPGLPAQAVKTTYGTDDLPVSMTTTDGTGANIHLADETYNNIGQTTALDTGTYGSDTAGRANQTAGLQRNYTWDPATGRLVTAGADVKSTDATTYTALNLGYTYDQVGNPTRITDTSQTAAAGTAMVKQFCYGFDPAQRLIHAATGAASDTSCATPKAAPTPIDQVQDPDYDISYGYTGDRLSSVTDNLTHDLSGNPLSVTYQTGNAGAGGSPHQTTKTNADAATLNSLLHGGWPRDLPAPGSLTWDNQGRVSAWAATATINTGQTDLLNLTDNYTYVYDHQGQLTSTTPVLAAGISNPLAKTVTNAYRADGTRLIRQTDTVAGVVQQTTLYLADGTELTTNTVGNTSARDYTTPAGTPVAAVTASVGLPPAWTDLFADGQGSLRLAADLTTAGHATTHLQQYYPYGDTTANPPPATPGNRGYLDKPHDPNGDLRLDERAYTPNLNQLTTPDPILQPGDPLSANPYTYARNNPMAMGDPTGLDPTCIDRGECQYDYDTHSIKPGGPCFEDCPAVGAVNAQPDDDSDHDSGGNLFTHALGAAGSLAGKAGDLTGDAFGKARDLTVNTLEGGLDALEDPIGTIKGTVKGTWNEITECADDPGLQSCRKVLIDAGLTAFGGKLLKIAADARRAKRLEGLESAAKSEGRVLDDVEHLPCNCFVAGTKVHTADGTKPIQKIKIGDQVWAKNLTNGKNELRTVTGLFHKHTDQVMTITVTDGAKITVTQEHPFYVMGIGWVMSGDLRVGDPLAQRDGGSTTITDIDVRPADTTVYNFTVDGDHNYYVTEAQLLVHNCDLGASIAEHMGSRRLAGVHGSTDAYIESVIHGDAPLAEMRSIGQSGRAIWRDGRNIIIRDPTSAHGGTAFSKPSVDAAIRYFEEFE